MATTAIKLTCAAALGASVPFASCLDRHPGTLTMGGPPRAHQFNESDLTNLRTPNSTNSVKFSLGGESGWTWRVNVTDLSVPDFTLDGREPAGDDPRGVITTFDLQWPTINGTNHETLNETAKYFNRINTASSQSFASAGNSSEGKPICATVWGTPLLPNITNKHQDHESSSCEDAIGQQCVEAILESVSRTGSSSTNCQSPGLLRDLDACADVFPTGFDYTLVTSGISGPYLQDRANYSNYRSDASDPALGMVDEVQRRPGDAIFAQSQRPDAQFNSTAFRQAESQLRMMVLTGPGGIKEAVCMRVDVSIDDLDVSDIAQREDWDESGGEESIARVRCAAAMSTVGLVSLGVAAFSLL